MKREQSLNHGEAIDNFMNMDNAVRTLGSIDEQRDREIKAISKTDPEYEKKVKVIKQRAADTRYKAMKQMNNANEVIPARAKANMKRRASLQVTQPAK